MVSTPQAEAQSGIGSFFPPERARLLAGQEGPLLQIGRHESPKSQKDLHAALQMADALGVDLPLTRVAHDEMPAVWGIE